MNLIMSKLGIMTISMKKDVTPDFVESVRRGAGIEFNQSTFIVGRKLVMINGKTNKAVYNLDRAIRSIKSHFDGFYTIHEWAVDVEGRYTVVQQLFRNKGDEDNDGYNDFVIVWTSLDKDKLHEYIDGLFYNNCSCPGDTCGCWFTDLWTHKTIKVGPFAVLSLSHRRNV